MMTNPSDLSPLIEKIEAAEEGSLDLTREVHIAAKGNAPFLAVQRYAYTTSIDAIVGLIEREFPGCGWAVKEEINGAWAKVQPFAQGPTYKGVTLSTEPALAICAAFLRALQERVKG